jgi:hypothetical protein
LQAGVWEDWNWRACFFPLQAGKYLNAYWIMLRTVVYRTFCSQQNFLLLYVQSTSG